MGHVRHNAIIVTGFYPDVESAHKKALEVFEKVTPLVSSSTNGYESFLIPPDGGKERWDTSLEGDERRDKFVKFLRSGEIFVSWVEVQYGDDNGETEIIRHSDQCDTCNEDDENCECCADGEELPVSDRRAAVRATRDKK